MHPIVKEWQDLGLDAAAITSVALIHQKHGNEMYRICTHDRSYVLKYFSPANDAREIQVYRLLQEGGVPTLPVYACSERSILLEDLDTSPSWRLATEADVARAETGAAVGRWYRQLHDFGHALFQQDPARAAFLDSEYDALDEATIRETAEQLDLAGLAVWELAVQSVPVLKAALEQYPQTICYNDFYWTNLALSRDTDPIEAIVFDYHLVGRGTAYSDWRNVVGSLRPEAKEAFLSVYGPVDKRQAVLDEPLALLYGLAVAVKRPRLPQWALPLIEGVQRGHLERCLQEAWRSLGGEER